MRNRAEQWEKFDAARRRYMEKRLVLDIEEELENITHREEHRRDFLECTGIDIGTREDAIYQTGAYLDQSNLDRISLYYQEHEIGSITID